MNKFGIADEKINILFSIFKKHTSIETIIVYGSRAKGNFTERSDLDLIIKNAVDQRILSKVIFEINNSDFPYLVDLQDYTKIQNLALIDHIDRIGQIFYQK